MSPPSASSAEPLSRLRRILGGSPPKAIEKLGARDLTRLADAIETASRTHSEALSAALDESFAQVPGLLRGAVKRIVLR